MATENSEKLKKPSEHILVDHPEYVKAIGMISLETVDLELHLADLFSRMLGIPLKIGRAVCLTPKAENVRIEIIRHAAMTAFSLRANAKPDSILSRQKTEALKKVNKLLDRSLAIINKRHRAVHDDWNVLDGEKTVTRKVIDGRPTRQETPIKITELKQQITETRVLIDDIYELTQGFRKHPPLMVDLRKPKTDH